MLRFNPLRAALLPLLAVVLAVSSLLVSPAASARDKFRIGIAYPGGKTSGDKAKVKLRFTEQYMKLAADGKL